MSAPPEPPLRCGALILAAGMARRFGADKRHWRMADGRTLLQATLARYQGAFASVAVVLRPEDACWSSELVGCDKTYAAKSRLGMGHSLAAGVAAADHLDALFIALGDMPWVAQATLQALRGALRSPTHIVQPVHGGVAGHPVGFGRAYFPELRALTGDRGAKAVLRRHRSAIITLPFSDPGVVQDLDVPPQESAP